MKVNIRLATSGRLQVYTFNPSIIPDTFSPSIIPEFLQQLKTHYLAALGFGALLSNRT